MPRSSRASRSATRLHRSIILAGLAWLLLAAGRQPAVEVLAADTAAGPHIDVLTATGVVDNVMATYIEQGVARAADGDARAVVLTLNTPGGSLDATQRIVSTLLGAPIPTIVWVAPSGGRAASAGTFITLSAHLAYMAPGTNIGAASPVGAGGEELTGTIGDKVRNDAIANIRSIAESTGPYRPSTRRSRRPPVRPSRSAPSMGSPAPSTTSAARRMAGPSRCALRTWHSNWATPRSRTWR
jgi:membrane-bound ClpP family serine protease